MDVLLHMCCGPCSLAVIEWLLEQGHRVTGFFFNPNIHPLMEYMRRREAAMQATAHYGIPLVLADALPREEQYWSVGHGGKSGMAVPGGEPCDGGLSASLPCGDNGSAMQGFAGLPPAVDPVFWLRMIHEHEEKRCALCWASRLKKTAEYAARHGYEAITSSLLYSRYQEHALIKKQAELFARGNGLETVYADFREFWQYGIDRSKELGLYRQPYCGCVLSEYERYAKKMNRLLA